ncbi:hypothetical protein CMEL01_07600 [Colletotrichum melonis]|uniref:Uncharacterized protein n=1 Tax=Colletotrichum melonis TaxID=1209925 RepID=A0AAI9U495_9PEZI|nr:hypothetical protein CMEL01_07600 [Colletotrichum melonis]
MASYPVEKYEGVFKEILNEVFLKCRDANNTEYFMYIGDFTCKDYDACECPMMIPQPDIAGTGVLVAFALTAFFTLLSAIFCIVVGRTNQTRRTFNPIDRYGCEWISEPLRRFMFRRGMNPDLYSLVAYDLVNTFSDLQLVTGLAVLVAGIKELVDEKISIYHFLIVTDLAWFCTNAHLLSLVVTRGFSDSVKRTHPQRCNPENTEMTARLARALRIVLMAATFLLLQISFWATGYEDVYNPDRMRCPMRCTLGKEKGGWPRHLMVANMTLMAYFYALQTFLSWRTGRIFWMDHIRGSLIDKQGQSINVLNPEIIFKRWTENKFLKTLRMSLLAFWYFLASEVGNLVGLTLYFGFGIYSLLDDKRRLGFTGDDYTTHGESEIVYSQLVPIFLLIIPFMGIFESHARHSKTVKESEAKEVGSCTSEGS